MTRRRTYQQTIPSYTPPEEQPQTGSVVWQEAPRYDDLPPRRPSIRTLFLAGVLVLAGMMVGRYVELPTSVPALVQVGREYSVRILGDPHCTEYEEWIEPVEFPPSSGKRVNIRKAVCVGELLYVQPANEIR